MIARLAVLAPLVLVACASHNAVAVPDHEAAPPKELPISKGLMTTPLRLEDLPRAMIPDPIAPPSPPEVGRAPGDRTDEIVFQALGDALPGYHRIQLKEAGLATIWLEGQNKGAREHTIACGPLDEHPHLSPLRWATLAPSGAGARLDIRDGWIDESTCEATITKRFSVVAAPIIPGLLYGYRTERELYVLFPGMSAFVASESTEAAARSALEPDGIAEVALALGDRGVSFVAAVDPKKWMAALHPADGSAIVADLPVAQIGLEVTRSSREAGALAIAYITAPRPGTASFSAEYDYDFTGSVDPD